MNRLRSDRVVIILAVAIFAALSLAASVTSSGFLEADGCTHYLYARYAFSEPHYLLNIWGRPLVTAMYAIPAQIAGRFGVRCTSLLIAIALSLVAHAIAKQQGLRRPALAAVFTLAQPLVFLHSFSELTELPFALLLGLTFLVHQRSRWLVFSMLASLLPLARPEGFGFVLLAAVALLVNRRPLFMFLLPLPLILWSYLGWRTHGSTPQYPWFTWLIHNWPYAEYSTYQPGSAMHFIALLPAVVSPLLMPALIVGIWRSLRRRQLLVTLIPLIVLTGHGLLYATGRMASSGEIRYMLIVAPFWAVLVALGWEWFFTWRGWQRFEIWAAAIAALAPILCNRMYQVLPRLETDDWLRAQRAAAWVQRTPLSKLYPRVQAAHPGVYYFLDFSQTEPTRSVEWRADLLEPPRPGTILIWDDVYATHNADRARIAELDELISHGWIPIHPPAVDEAPRGEVSSWRVLLSPLDINRRATEPHISR